MGQYEIIFTVIVFILAVIGTWFNYKFNHLDEK